MALDDLDRALAASDAAAQLALRYFHEGVAARRKADGSLVSDADPAVERLLRDDLAADAPDDGFLGEELGTTGGTDRCWILDPIDGTTRFVHGDPYWRVHVALAVGERVDVAVVTAPAIGRQWWAVRGGGAFEARWPGRLSERRLAVSSTSELRTACYGGLDEDWWRLPPHGRMVVRSPGWCAGILAVLYGQLDGFLADRFQVWDHAPWTLLVEEAGGRFTDGRGRPSLGQGGGLYSNGAVHDDLLDALDDW